MRRIPQNVSSAVTGLAAVSMVPRTRSITRAPSGSEASAATIASSPPAERTSSPRGRNVMPSP